MQIDREYSETQRQRKELKRWENRQGDIEDSETQTFFVCLTKFKNNQTLLNKISH